MLKHYETEMFKKEQKIPVIKKKILSNNDL